MPDPASSLLGQRKQPASTTVKTGSVVRNLFTGEQVYVEAVSRKASRFRLSCDARGPAAEVGWAPEGLDAHWEHVDDA